MAGKRGRVDYPDCPGRRRLIGTLWHFVYRCGAAFEVGRLYIKQADVAQSVERVLGKDEVTSSILVVGSRKQSGEGKSSGETALNRTRGGFAPSCFFVLRRAQLRFVKG